MLSVLIEIDNSATIAFFFFTGGGFSTSSMISSFHMTVRDWYLELHMTYVYKEHVAVHHLHLFISAYFLFILLASVVDENSLWKFCTSGPQQKFEKDENSS